MIARQRTNAAARTTSHQGARTSDPLPIAALPSCWVSLYGDALLRMTMNENDSIRASCSLYNIVQNLTLFHTAYQAHLFANVLHSITVHAFVAQILEPRAAPTPSHLASIGIPTNDLGDPRLSTVV